jgi:hypothetical protein
MSEEMKDEEMEGIDADQIDLFDQEPGKMEKLEVSSEEGHLPHEIPVEIVHDVAA